MDTLKETPEYTKPKITDYGDLRELTAASINAGITDSPKGVPGPTVFSPPPGP